MEFRLELFLVQLAQAIYLRLSLKPRLEENAPTSQSMTLNVGFLPFSL
jgi:hypothetical protein